MHADKRKSSERRIFELRAEIETQLRYGNTVDALERLDAIQQIEKFSRPSKPTRGKMDTQQMADQITDFLTRLLRT